MVIQTLRNEALTAPFVALAMAAIAAVAWAMGAVGTQALSPQATLWLKSLLVAPVIEELFFRGVVQSGLRARAAFRGRPWLLVGVTALVFALAHLMAAPALHAALVFVPACAIGWVYERTRSIGTCAVLHSAANAVWLLIWSV